MYSKDIYSPRRSPYVKPPRNYSGTAFSESPPTPPSKIAEPETQAEPEASLPDEQIVEEPCVKTAENAPPPPEAEPEAVPIAAKNERPTPPRGILSSLIPPFFGDSDSVSVGFEELLLIGLMFLVSQGERDTDTLLMLMLLLFYK